MTDPCPGNKLPTTGIIEVRVRYVECDPMGVAHHASYLPWLEMGRTELLRAGGMSYADVEAAGYFLVITRLEIRYRRPIRYDDVLLVTTTVAQSGRVKIEHSYQIVRKDDPTVILTTATSTLACVGRDGAVRELPAVLNSHEGETA